MKPQFYTYLLRVGLLSAIATTTFALKPATANQAEPLATPQAAVEETLVEAEPVVEVEPIVEAESVVEEKSVVKAEPAVEATPAPSPAINPEVNPNNTPTVPASAPIAVSEADSTAVTPAASGIKILSPTMDALIKRPATSVVIEYEVDQQVDLYVNGKAVDRGLIGRTETNAETGRVQETWYGVILSSGSNTLSVQLAGESTPASSITVAVPGEPERLKVTTREALVPADGRSTATVLGQLIDEEGNLSTWDAKVTLEASEGEFVGVDASPDAPGFQVEAIDGEFTAELRSSLNSGPVRIRASQNEMEAYHKFQFATPVRPSGLLAGSIDLRFGARGTNFYDSFRDFLPTDRDNGFEFDAKAHAFATTSIGNWLFTGAFNSERPLNADCRGEATLFRASVDCDGTNYAVYGDDSTSDIVAPSIDHFYARIERTSPVPGAGTDYFMWGDYTTAEFAQPSQLFSATNRALHGFKGNYNIGNLQVTGLYANNTDGFQRDTIAPDGTSGFYFLSRRLLIPGSEQVFLELEELDRPGTVLERERLSRGADYEIDYDRGTLLFRRPILRTDVDDRGDILVRRIVTTYQFEGEGGGTSIYGGRLQYNFARGLDQETFIGATYLREDGGDQDFQLFGADAYVSLGGDRRLIAEYAHSKNDLDFGDTVSGNAYRVELEGSILKSLYGRAYFSHTDSGFANTATTTFVPGQTRYGAELTADISDSTSLRASYDHEDNFGVAPQPLNEFESLIRPGFDPIAGTLNDTSLTTIRAGVQQKIGKGTLAVDYVHRDRSGNRGNVSSDQISSSFVTPLAKNLQFHAYNDLTLSSDTDPIYANRTTVGVDWQVHPGISIGLNQSYFSGGQFGNSFLTSLDIKGEHTFSTNTTLRGQLSVLGDRGIAGYFGIDQGVTLAPGLRADFTYERVFSTGFRNTGASRQFSQPVAVGSGASALGLTSGDSFSVGLAYTDNPDFQAKARLEYRTSASQGSNLVISADALGRINDSWTTLLSYQQASSANQNLSGLGTSRNLKLGVAYRNPKDDRFNALLRYEYRQNPSTTPESILFGRGSGSTDHLLAAEAIYAPNWRWELYGKVGLRHSRSTLASDLIGTSTVTLAQLRATHRFNYRWDVSAEARWIGQPSAGFNEFGVVGEVGYYLNPNLRLGAGYVFGNVNDRDLGNSRSASGPFFGLTVKLDNNLLKDFGFGQKRPSKNDESVQPETVEAQATEDQLQAQEPSEAKTN